MTGTSAPASSSTPRYEVAEVFRQYGDAYRSHYPVSHEQRAVMRAIEDCRTAALGGHVDECDACGALRISYNSCRNRHCPKCGALAKAAWLERRCAELLPIEYYHVVFTTDHAINPLARCNPRTVYELLFQSAAATLRAFGDQYLGGEVGVLTVLHTWGQDLGQHIHLHCIVTGGALARDGSRWRSCPRGFLFPVIPLAAAFRDRFCQGLAALAQARRLVFAGACADLAEPARFTQLVAEMQAKAWEVYAKRPLNGPEQVLDYLGRYVQRVAISNHRLLAIDAGQVRFRWRDYRHGSLPKEMALSAEEFIRRFLLHVLPRGFVRIRYYGLLHYRQRAAKLRRCRELLGAPAVPTSVEAPSAATQLLQLTGVDLSRCPLCQVGRMIQQTELSPMRGLRPMRWNLPAAIGAYAGN